MSESDVASLPCIAVIGMACRLPGANTPEELWQILSQGNESITRFTEEQLLAAGASPCELIEPGFVPAKGIIDQADHFDAGFFGFSPREAALLDPQQRVFLECAWTALEDAGYDALVYPGAISVFAGSILSIYLLQNLWPSRDLINSSGIFQTAIGNDPTFLATNVSYHLDLHGPSVSIGTACSTSLMAVHLACQSLLAHESDMALAGGVSIHLPLQGGYLYKEGGILSPDGHCRPFDSEAKGTVSSDGAGVVVLKRYQDAVADGDIIHALIRGSAANNDGSLKVGFTAPSVTGEANVIREALAIADVLPETISMVEAHGAGTLLGDPIEVAALTEAFGDCGGKQGFCALGSVKSNLGHVDAAAGIAGFLKVVLALRHQQVPPILHFEKANPQLDLKKSPFYVNNQLVKLGQAERPLRAGVNSFGIGGTNVHVVLEEAPEAIDKTLPREQGRPFDLLMFSARTSTALEAMSECLAQHFEQNHGLSLADVGWTLRQGRRMFDHRRFLVCSDLTDAVEVLSARSPKRLFTGMVPAERPKLAFLFPGLGDHYPGMGWELYCLEREFRNSIDRSAELLRPHLDSDIRDFLYPDHDWSHPVLALDAERLHHNTGGADGVSGLDLRAMLGRSKTTDDRAPQDVQPAEAQPGIFVTELALAELLGSWGIKPDAMLGHSIGEFVAACLAGVLTPADALQVVACRARLIQERVAKGAMLAIPLSSSRLADLMPSGVSLAAINGASVCVASGEGDGIAELRSRLEKQGVSSQRLPSTHAYHSEMMATISEPLLAVLKRVDLKAPRIPYVSCITGTWIEDEEATDPKYWARHLCRTVQFQQALSQFFDDPRWVLVEAGPGQGLTSHAIGERARISGRENRVIPTMRWSYSKQSEQAVLLGAVGQLWLAGVTLDGDKFLHRTQRRRVQLPTYPFERKRYWIDPPSSAEPRIKQLNRTESVTDWFYLPCWKPSIRPQRRLREGNNPNWLVFVDSTGVGTDLADHLRQNGCNVTTVMAGSESKINGDNHTINLNCQEDYRAIFNHLSEQGCFPTNILHLLCLTDVDVALPTSKRFAQIRELGYDCLLHLFRAASRQGLESSLKVNVIANHVLDITGTDPLMPEKATLRAPLIVAPQEYPGHICRIIDTDLSPVEMADRERLISQILDEVLSEADQPVVAYRSDRRQIQAYEQVRIDRSEDHMPFRERGVYLLTGGLGGIGLILAQHLAQKVKARLALLSRLEFPDRDNWQSWCEEHDSEDPVSQKIHQLLILEELGSEVLVLCADVSQEEAMRSAIASVDQVYGELHGVFHCAGAVGIQAFKEINEATVCSSSDQFVAKVHGLMVLDSVLAGRQLDFCLLMSSLSAVLGGIGFAAYSAANMFMDSYAQWRNRSTTGWMSVDWDSWQLAQSKIPNVGFGKSVREFFMKPEEGVEACERILAQRNLVHVVVSTGDFQSRLAQWVEQKQWIEPTSLHKRPFLETSFLAPRSALEIKLAEIWQELFGIDAVGINDNFFELGGHSLLATQLSARLHASLQVEMSLAVLLQAPTIADLAVAVVAKQAETADPAELVELIKELGDLSANDIQMLLAMESEDPDCTNDDI